MNRCPHCGEKVPASYYICTYCKTVISRDNTNLGTGVSNSPASTKPVQSSYPSSYDAVMAMISKENANSGTNVSNSPATTKPAQSPYSSNRDAVMTIMHIIAQNSANSGTDGSKGPAFAKPTQSSYPANFDAIVDIDDSARYVTTEKHSKMEDDSIKKKRTNANSIWWYIVIYMAGFILLSKDKKFAFSLDDTNSILELLLFLIAPMFCGAILIYGSILVLAIPLSIISGIFGIPLAVIFSAVKDCFPKKCPHGKFNGEKSDKKTGRVKCPLCQELIDEQLRQQQIKIVEEQLRRKYQEQHDIDIAAAKEKRKNTLRVDSRSIHAMSPQAFEDMIATLFRKMGYRVEQTPYSNDGGKDAIIYKNGKKYLVECKRYREEAAVTRPHMQKLLAAMVEEDAEGGFFVASCRYTQEALEYGRKFNIETIDLSKLLMLLHRYNDSSPNSKCYKLTCEKCGKSVFFDLWDDVEYKKCLNGHLVQNAFWNCYPQKRSKSTPKYIDV